MKISHKIGLVASIAVMGLALVACGGKSNSGSATKTVKYSAALVTDGGGVDDKSFNQSGWEGLEAWGKKNGLKKGVGGYNYAQSNSDADFTPNINKLIQAKYATIFGIGYKLESAIKNAAKANPKTNFVIIDDVIDAKNVASVTFKDNEGAFLAGVAAAETTKTKKVGFIGGMHGAVIDRFEAGFRQGVAAVDKNISVDVKYANDFSKPDVGQALANAMFNNDEDVIYQAAGGTGMGVFSAAKNQIKKKKVWVIGVDRDQTPEGKYSGGNLTLTSTVKGVDIAVEKLADDAKDGKFPGGKTTVYGLKEKGVKLARGNMSAAAWKAVQDYQQQIIDGKIKVAEKPSQLKK
ncbi:BMP family lipoprotein [Schleiferilactobacillus harbinensis]|uniref:BMP family protein n=2 Tax=Schleiferilactobacillus harbinensis TaxID=304207 RepID=A0ABU7SYH2_9LACO|nr:BMP family protein [Schleiferilactobacillus harbinensis]KRM27599.1 ABC superfamily ATP binding cassette transporter, binding protein [Schleiferilactobacillus harbinensis DSM 16991]GEK06953.1 BMP family ABC transporter substrate-binding protein [Schleiferilactobacillus harbinensis]